MDYDNLNTELGDSIDKVIEQMDDPDNEYYAQSQAMKLATTTLRKLGFEDDEDENTIFSRKQKDKEIRIIEVKSDPDDGTVKLDVIFAYDDGSTRNVIIPLAKMKDFIDQPEIPELREHQKVKRAIADEVRQYLLF